MRLIDADKLLDILDVMIVGHKSASDVYDVVDSMPTVDADPVKHGHWRYDEALELEWCSECGFGKRKGDKRWYSYCPNCGAYMGVVKHETD